MAHGFLQVLKLDNVHNFYPGLEELMVDLSP
jgi:hypothetical protein